MLIASAISATLTIASTAKMSADIIFMSAETLAITTGRMVNELLAEGDAETAVGDRE